MSPGPDNLDVGWSLAGGPMLAVGNTYSREICEGCITIGQPFCLTQLSSVAGNRWAYILNDCTWGCLIRSSFKCNLNVKQETGQDSSHIQVTIFIFLYFIFWLKNLVHQIDINYTYDIKQKYWVTMLWFGTMPTFSKNYV